ncbi:Serine/threonine-protein kinase Nek8 [Nibea albiflora]|uniref:Serine/threonine-protein kinase Nek8 n=1 Tax=Nibea albiflora TaxID=240163 RepID=A0ACB7FE40_NIBAL|nr:Serine/threonine-protein kinase Nek8 [Nibea albiflora]
MPQMLDVSVWGTDKALHKFESGMPTSQGLGGEILAAGQVLDSGGGGGGGGGGEGDKERQGMKDERALFTMLMNHFLLIWAGRVGALTPGSHAERWGRGKDASQIQLVSPKRSVTGGGRWVKREEKAASPIPWDACLLASLMPPWEKRKGWHFSLTIGLRGDNKIFAWGNGTSGQLGDGERSVKNKPVEVTLPQELSVEGSDGDVADVSIVGVACGSRHSFIWTDTGQAYSFGNNFYAQLGYDFQRADFKEHQFSHYSPREGLGGGWQGRSGVTAEEGFCPWMSLDCYLSVYLGSSRLESHYIMYGRVQLSGQNDYGQIGSGSNENAVVPRFVEGVDHVSKVTCGANHSLALTGDGRLFQWGCGRACGNIKRNVLFPEEVMSPSSPVRDIAGGCWHSLLLTGESAYV